MNTDIEALVTQTLRATREAPAPPVPPGILDRVYRARRRQRGLRALGAASVLVVAGAVAPTVMTAMHSDQGESAAQFARRTVVAGAAAQLPPYTPAPADGWVLDGTTNRAGVDPNGQPVATATFDQAEQLRGLAIKVTCAETGTLAVSVDGREVASVACTADQVTTNTFRAAGAPGAKQVTVAVTASGFAHAQYRVWVRPSSSTAP